MAHDSPGQALRATAEHAVMLQHKIKKLQAAQQETMAVVADLAAACEADGDLPSLQQARIGLRIYDVPHRRPVTDAARRAEIAARNRELTMRPGEVRWLHHHQHRWPIAEHFVYLLMDNCLTVFYVGQTGRLSHRMKDHRKRFGMRLTDVQVIACESREEALSLEADLVFHHQPSENQVGRDRRTMKGVA